MSKFTTAIIFTGLVMSLPLLMTSCAQKKATAGPAETESEPVQQEAKAPEPPVPPVPVEQPEASAPDEQEMPVEKAETDPREPIPPSVVYFDFDSVRLNTPEQEALRKKAEWLAANPDIRITIEGHCDRRGTSEYNMALGERRAAAVKAYLENLGIEADRMTGISFGEEKPANPGEGDEAHRENRRAEFRIEERSDS